jgi:hypothetical protein
MQQQHPIKYAGQRNRFPLEYRDSQCRLPTGRGDDIPACQAPIMEQLTAERKASGRVGHWNSRRPLLGVTADEEGSFPDTWSRSTTPMFPAPSRQWQANFRPDAVENADPSSIDATFLTTDANYTELARRIYQDRGAQGYGNKKLVDMRDPTEGRIVTANPAPMGFQSYMMPTNRIQYNLTQNLNGHELNQANVAHSGRENLQKIRQGGEFVNNTGFMPGHRLLNSRIQIGEDEGRSGGMRGGIGEVANATRGNSKDGDWRRSGSVMSNMPVSLFPCSLQASGAPRDQVAGDLYTYDPYNVDQGLVRGDARKIFAVDVSGAATTVVQGPVRMEGIGEYRPTDMSVLGTGVEFGYDATDIGMNADRFQKRRTFLFDTRPEQRSVMATVETSGNPHTLQDAPVVIRGREYRQGVDTQITQGNAYRLDTGLLLDSMQPNAEFQSESAFYSTLQGQRALF